MKTYFNQASYLEAKIKKDSSQIYQALLKYGYSNFQLEILEYTTLENILEREQYYLDFLKPEYNILKIAGSSLGFKYSEETKAKMKVRSKKQQENLKNLQLDPEYRAKNLEHLKRLHSSPEHLEHLKRIHSIQSHQVSVLDTLTDQVTVYPSISAAARAIGCADGTIRNALKVLKEKGVSRLIKKRFMVKIFTDSLFE